MDAFANISVITRLCIALHTSHILWTQCVNEEPLQHVRVERLIYFRMHWRIFLGVYDSGFFFIHSLIRFYFFVCDLNENTFFYFLFFFVRKRDLGKVSPK